MVDMEVTEAKFNICLDCTSPFEPVGSGKRSCDLPKPFPRTHT